MIYAIGNNREALKFKTVFVPVVIRTGIPVFSRNYFPELPDLNNKKIVGIQLNTKKRTTQTAPDQIPIRNPAIQDPLNGSSIGSYNADQDICRYSTLNLVNNEDQLVIDNYPLNQLIAGTVNSGYKKNKIMPFDVNINIRKSYINYFFSFIPLADDTIVFNITFFYKD